MTGSVCRRRAVIAALVTCLVATGAAAASVEEATSGPLRVLMALTLDEALLRRSWAQATDAPRLEVVEQVPVGATVTTVLVFQGCQAGEAGRCDLRADFTLITPDGQRIVGGHGVLWSAGPSVPDHGSAAKWLLGSASMSLKTDARLKGRSVRLEATVRDLVAHRVVTLSVPLSID